MNPGTAELFRILGDGSRIRIIELLKQKGPLCVKDISEALGITPSAVSQHLKILRHASLVRNERKGYWIPYEVDPAALEECQGLLSRVCNCGCMCRGEGRKGNAGRVADRIAFLRWYERELRRELKEVRNRIEELEGA